MVARAGRPRVAIIIVAAGSGRRLGLETPKGYVDLGGQTLLERATRGAAQANLDATIVAVVPSTLVAESKQILACIDTPVHVVVGGETRHDSVACGLASLASFSADDVDVVLIHDVARALTPPAVFEDVVRAVIESGEGVVASMPLVDTITSVDAHGNVNSVVDRSTLAAMQTPQGFPRADFEAAHAHAAQARGGAAQFTDDASVFLAAGYRVRTCPGDSVAFKITTLDDLHRAAGIVADAPGPFGNVPADIDTLAEGRDLRVGTGVDTHAFTDDPSVELKLAGLTWPGERGLSGHSDGDAVAHAVCDALLTAAGLGDIGSVFGTDDPRFAGASGDVFVTHAVTLLAEAGYEPVNVTVQIIGNRPRLSARRGEAESTVSAWVGAPVAVSATTTDGLGFTGRGEGIAAVATALIRARR